MSTESEILAEVELLKAKFSDTRALYREVCVLLFFRHGITPTANKLYQYVHRGSMNVPTEELGKFWDDLRHKARVDIEHPDLPEAVKTIAAEAVASLWRQASEAARTELAGARLELQADAERAREVQRAAEEANRAAQESMEQLLAEVAQREEADRALRAELETERRAHALVQGRVQELQAQIEQARAQQQRQQEAFSADLAKARGDIEAAQERAAAAERRALLEIEQERQARARADKTAEGLREKLGEAESRERQRSLEHAEAATRTQMELSAKSTALSRALECQEALEREAVELRQQLSYAQQSSTRHEAEAQTLKVLVDRLTPRAAAAATSTKARRKAP
jgi:hypothetical protein